LDLPSTLAKRLVIELESSEAALNEARIDYFAQRLPPSEYWRLIPEFDHSIAYLDIETTGLSRYYHSTTVIGLLKDDEYRVFVAGANLEEFPRAIKGCSILVTFNGKLFDIPFLRNKMSRLSVPLVHLDLRFLCRRLGLTGGLKEVEKRLGIRRSSGVEDFDGYDATILWRRYCRGNDNALELLVRYNMEDTVNLRPLLRETVLRLQKQITSGMSAKGIQTRLRGETFDKGRVLPKILPTLRSAVVEKPIVAVRGIDGPEKLLEMRVGSSRPVRVKRSRIQEVTLKFLLERLGKYPPTVIGIDLSASDKRESGWAWMRGSEIETALLRTDEQIIDATIESIPTLISIDSPLSLPAGRDCTRDDCECRKFGIMREAERVLKSRGINVYPSLIRSMQPLTERGIRLAKRFKLHGFNVIESYPGAAQDMLGIIRKKVDVEELQLGLEDFGATARSKLGKSLGHDELDAVTSAIVGYFYLTGTFEPLGSQDEGQIIVPRVRPETYTTGFHQNTPIREVAPRSKHAAS